MVVHIMPYSISAFGISDIGLVRQNNEDFWAKLNHLNFYVLADGMGGHRAGEVASKETVKALCKIIETNLTSREEKFTIEEAYAIVQIAIEQVNQIIYRMGRSDHELRGMGTTLCCIYFHPKGVIYAHVGDSRIYRLRHQKLEQLTKDHSLFCELVELGQISEQQATDFLYKNIITKAVGTEPFVEPSVHISDAQDQDIYIMCSDGLSDLLSRKEIETILNRTSQVETAANHLVEKAKQKGGYDNVTVVVMKVKRSDESKNLSR